METWFVCSDIHDDTEALKAFADYAQAQQANRLILLGDLSLRPYKPSDFEKLVQDPNRQAIYEFIQAKRAHNDAVLLEMKRTLDGSGIQYHVIPGNYDPALERLFGEHDLHSKTTILGEAKTLGYGGADASPAHIELLAQMNEVVSFDHRELLYRLLTERPTIGLIHNPPKDYCDDLFDGKHVGTPATKAYIFEHQPKLIISGHIHEAGPNGNNPNGVRGIQTIRHNGGKTTTVLNPGNLGRFELILNPETLEPFRAFDYGTFIQVKVEADGTPKQVVQYTLQPLSTRGIGQVRTLEEYKIS